MIGTPALALLALLASLSVQAQPTPAKTEKIEPVAVVGCLKERTPGAWTLVNASEPVASTANAPSAKELAALPKGGKREFQLIGVAIFDLPAHRDHLVAVKGLPIKAPSSDRLNITSVTKVADACGSGG